MSSYKRYNLPNKDTDNHYDFDLGDEWYVEGEWCYYSDYRIKLDGPATGWETVQLYQQIPGVTDGAYIYYITNRLIKAKPDGSGQVELDGATDYFIDIWKVENGWVYYQKNDTSYRIRTDGSVREVRE
jgi:hypothetical protein